MLAVVQRVSRANVRVKENIVGEIDGGLVILLGIEKGDDEKDATSLAHKISVLRMFNDDNDKMNLSILDVNGAALVISQFTLCADTKKGRRPRFLNAESPDLSNNLVTSYAIIEVCSAGFAITVFPASKHETI